MSQNVADFVLARLRDWGVRQVFGFPGDGINGLLAAWGRAGNDPQFVQSRHEEMSAFEAVGFAKFSGTFGVCAATSGCRRTARRPCTPPSRRRSPCSATSSGSPTTAASNRCALGHGMTLAAGAARWRQ